MRWSCLPILLAAVALPLGTAYAGDGKDDVAADGDERARELFIKGDRAYAEGDYEGALAAFEEAYALSGRHALLYNMANAHERLGEYEKALDKLRKFLPHASKSQQSLLEKRMRSLEMRLDEQRAAAEKQPEPSAVPPPPVEQPKQAPPDSGVTVNGEPAPPLLGYGLVGLGALGVGLGAYFGMQALDARSTAEDRCPGGRCTADAQDAIDRDKRNSLLADISLGAGIVSATVGVYIILTHDDSGRETEAGSRIVAAPRTGGGEVDFVVRF